MSSPIQTDQTSPGLATTPSSGETGLQADNCPGIETEMAHASGWPPLLHPHCGSRFLTFWRQYFKHWPYDLRSIYQRGFALFSTTVRVPAMTYERLRHDRKIAAEPLAHGPVFIIGHWRSGTTYLHNLLSHDPQFAWMSFSRAAMPLDCLTPVRPGRDLMNLLLPKTRGMDRMAMDGDTPQEEEIALGVLGEISFYRGLYYPRSIEEEFRRSVLMQDLRPGELELLAKNYRYLAQKMAYAYGGKTVLFKNPASTARMTFLKGVFPNAKFIHIVRNPYDVFSSMRNLLQRSFDAFAWQNPKRIELNELVLSFYERTMQAHLADRVGVPAGDYCEVRFEDLESDAGGVVREIYRKLAIPEVGPAMSAISGHVRSQDSYQKNVHELSAPLLRRIRERWAFAFERWGY